MTDLNTAHLIRESAKNMQISIQKEEAFKLGFKVGHLLTQQDTFDIDSALDSALMEAPTAKHLDSIAEAAYRMISVPKV